MNIVELQNWFLRHVRQGELPYELSREQAEAVLDPHKNALITARAGSGKTHTLIAKVVYLIALEGVPASKILALVFNREPREDFQRRLDAIRVDGEKLPGVENLARTFHSLAHEFGHQTGEYLCDQEQEAYIAEIVNKVINPQYLYDFVRDDSYEPRREDYATDQDYYATIRNLRYEALDGSRVKSRGEKIIADFLFEHDLDFKYEGVTFYLKKLKRYATPDSLIYFEDYDELKPDFCLEVAGEKILWEHWGISGDETDSESRKLIALASLATMRLTRRKWLSSAGFMLANGSILRKFRRVPPRVIAISRPFLATKNRSIRIINPEFPAPISRLFSLKSSLLSALGPGSFLPTLCWRSSRLIS